MLVLVLIALAIGLLLIGGMFAAGIFEAAFLTGPGKEKQTAPVEPASESRRPASFEEFVVGSRCSADEHHLIPCQEGLDSSRSNTSIHAGALVAVALIVALLAGHAIAAARTIPDKKGADELQVEPDHSRLPVHLRSRIGDQFPHLAGFETLQGSIVRGKRVFAASGCASCHSVVTDKIVVGPSLADVGERLTRWQLAEAIIDPSRTLAAGFATVSVTTTDGRSFTATLISQTPESVVIELDGVVERFDPKSIEVSPPRSKMPDNVARRIRSAQEMADLLEFLRSPTDEPSNSLNGSRQ
jgi:putative heme-binding domain-containing protein